MELTFTTDCGAELDQRIRQALVLRLDRERGHSQGLSTILSAIDHADSIVVDGVWDIEEIAIRHEYSTSYSISLERAGDDGGKTTYLVRGC